MLRKGWVREALSTPIIHLILSDQPNGRWLGPAIQRHCGLICQRTLWDRQTGISRIRGTASLASYTSSQPDQTARHAKVIKIGVTIVDGLLRRLKAIQSSNHTKIRLMKVMEFSAMRDAEKRENELHAQFAKLAHIEHGFVGYEWFASSTELERLIKAAGIPLSEVTLALREIDKETIARLFA